MTWTTLLLLGLIGVLELAALLMVFWKPPGAADAAHERQRKHAIKR